MTKTAAVMGSPLYMSPEQMQSARDVDATTDIWALGVILYELLSGRVPFNGDTLPEVCLKIAMQPPPPLRTVRPDAPAELEAVIMKCLEKDRSKRYRNVAELARALFPFGPRRARASVDRISRVIQNAGLSASAVALPPSSSSESVPASSPSGGDAASTKTSASWGQTGGTAVTKGSRAGLVAVVAFAAVGLVAGAAFLVRRGSSLASVAPPGAVAAGQGEASAHAQEPQPSSSPTVAPVLGAALGAGPDVGDGQKAQPEKAVTGVVPTAHASSPVAVASSAHTLGGTAKSNVQKPPRPPLAKTSDMGGRL
jgi:hypothetical protein